MKSHTCSIFFSGRLILFFITLLAFFPLAGFSDPSLVAEVEAAKQEVSRLEAKAYEECPILPVLVKMEKDAHKAYTTDKFRTIQKKSVAYTDQIKKGSDAMSCYFKMRSSYLSIASRKLITKLLNDDSLRPTILAFWRFMSSARNDYEDVTSMSDEELEVFILSDLKKNADKGLKTLQEVQKQHLLPDYVAVYCRLWSEAETTQGFIQTLVMFRTPKDLADARERLNKLETQLQNLIIREKREQQIN